LDANVPVVFASGRGGGLKGRDGCVQFRWKKTKDIFPERLNIAFFLVVGQKENIPKWSLNDELVR